MKRSIIAVCVHMLVVCVCVAQIDALRAIDNAGMRQEIRVRAAHGENVKCGSSFRWAWNLEHSAGSARMSELASTRPALQDSRLSASGKFRIHFDTTGGNVPALLDTGGNPVPGSYSVYVDSTAAILEFVLSRIVGDMHFATPPDDTAGGDQAYDVYIESMPFGVFGETVPDGSIGVASGSDRLLSYMVIDNDFANLRTSGLNGLRITTAHELFHAVQLGAYGVWDTREYYFYELSSVWMETMIFPSIEDYLADVPLYFSGFSGASLATYTTGFRGYERSVFALYLAQRFGPEVMRETWEAVRQARVLAALDAVLRTRGSSLRQGYREFAVWNYFTGDRTDTTRSYTIGRKLPRMTPALSTNWITPSVAMSLTSDALSQFTWAVRTGNDTLSIVVVNTNATLAQQSPISRETAAMKLSWDDPTGPAQRLVSGAWLGVDVENSADWTSEVFSAQGKREVPPATERPWPSPWILSEDLDLVMPVRPNEAGPFQVSFVSSSGSVIAAGERPLEQQRGMNVVRLRASDVRGRLSSGIYVVTLRKDSDVDLWKVAVVR